MKATREVETKLGVPDGFEPPQLVAVPGVDRVAVRRLRLKATYWDTEDRRLAREGVTLPHRTGEGRPCWTLKTPSSSTRALDREELTVLGPSTRVPEVVVDLLTARLRGERLVALAQVRSVRTTTLLFDADGVELVEVVDDQVTVLRDGATADGWHEVEVEQRPSGDKVASRVLRALRDAGAVDVDQTPKGVRALAPLPGHDLPQPPQRIRVAGDLVRASLAHGLRGLVEQDLAVRRDLPDAVHQMRVVCRRLRSDLQTFGPLLEDARVDLVRSELSWVADSLGAARDLEVLRDRVATRARDGDQLDVGALQALLQADREHAVETAWAALRSPRYVQLLTSLHELASAPGLTALAGEPADDVLGPLVAAAYRRLDKAVRALDRDSADDSWHRARIKAKRARYAAEAAAPVLGKPSSRAKKLQTRLGEHQDAVVAAERLLQIAEWQPDLAVVCGRLVERERRQTAAVRKTLLSRIVG